MSFEPRIGMKIDLTKLDPKSKIDTLLINTISFSCEIIGCDDKAAFRENSTELATGKNSDIYLCFNHFFEFKEYWEKNNPKQRNMIDKPKINARMQIEYKRRVKAAFDKKLWT